MTRLCFVVDQNIAWLKHPLRRRGFLVYAPGEDFPEDIDDAGLLGIAEETGCVVVSRDRYFENEPRAVYVPHTWLRRYNSWDLTTKVVKLAAQRVARP